MLYKALGFAVWKAAKWYVQRRAPSGRSLALGGFGVALLAGLIAAGLAKRGDPA